MVENGAYEGSYASARSYHRERDPSPKYLHAVWEVYEASLEYVIAGVEPRFKLKPEAKGVIGELRGKYPVILHHASIRETFTAVLQRVIQQHPDRHQLTHPDKVEIGVRILEASEELRKTMHPNRRDWEDHEWVQFHITFLMTCIGAAPAYQRQEEA